MLHKIVQIYQEKKDYRKGENCDISICFRGRFGKWEKHLRTKSCAKQEAGRRQRDRVTDDYVMSRPITAA